MDQDQHSVPPEGTLFDEVWYLNQYPGVAEAVQSGEFRSGWDHYVKCGRAEGREPASRMRIEAERSASSRDDFGDGPAPDKIAAARLAYQLLLGREELDDATLRAQSDFADIYELRERMLGSPEHRANERLMALARFLYTDEDAIASKTEAFNAFIAQEPATEKLIADITNEAGANNAYAYFHTRRFRDQIRATAALRQKRLGHQPVVKLLDVGQAPVTKMYAQVTGGIDLHTANLAMGASAEHEMNKYHSSRHYFIDFDSETLSEKYPELTQNQFDIIVFCEVIEHIRAAPEEQIQDMLKILAPGGALIVSTPNALSFNRIQRLSVDRKWDSVYSRKNRHLHDDHHIHVREFTLTEMQEAVREAGGETMMFGIADYYTERTGNMVRSKYISSREVQTLIVTHPGARIAFA